jgi:two-component system, OmpR family, phosphate regulon sensor histidine kinase PhoR
MHKLRTRLTLIFIVIIGLSVLTSGLYMAYMIEESHMNTLRQQMKREIRIIESMLGWSELERSEASSVFFSRNAELLKNRAEARITFIAADGRVLGDSDHAPETMDNHLNRPEIVQAREQGEGYSIRYSDTVLQNMMYVALPVGKAGDEGYIRLALSLQDVEHTIRKLWSTLAAGSVVFLLIAVVISYRIAFGFTRPLEAITKVAVQITQQNYDARVKVHSHDEIGQLGQALNRMADSLQEQMNTIRENEGRLQNVLENMISGVLMIDQSGCIVLLNRSAEEIIGFTSKELLGKHYKEAKQQLELTQVIQECFERHQPLREEMIFYFPEERMLEVNLIPMSHDGEESLGIVIVLHDITAIRRLEKMRSEFVANVSHELKTPIAAVKGFTETLMNGAMNDPETARAFLKIIFDESERLNRLIGDILELSKVESRRVPLRFSPVQLFTSVERSLEMMGAEANRKSIEMTMDVPEDIFVEADEDRLHQILINLISNGINYTPEGGKVRVSAEPIWTDKERGEYDRIRIQVTDTGIGVPKKDLPRIFERFYRVDKARSRSSGGTGLGLSIVKHIVELHRGTIRVDSKVGMGTTFIIELPVIH